MAYLDVTGYSGTARRPATASSIAEPFNINMPDLATGASQSNLAAMPYNVQIADIINATNRAAQEAANKARLGPGGEAIQSNLLTNLGRQSAGLLDPQTEAMLQSGMAQSFGGRGFGVDSSALAAAYRRALGQTIEGTEAAAAKQYEDLLAANPAAPLYNMENLMVTPQTYLSGAESNARLAEQARENALRVQLEYDTLAQREAEFAREQALREQQQQFAEEQFWTKTSPTLSTKPGWEMAWSPGRFLSGGIGNWMPAGYYPRSVALQK